MKRTVEDQFKTLCIVWAVLVLAQFMFLFVLFQAKPDVFRFDLSKPPLGDNPIFVPIFAVAAVFNLILGHVIKRRCFEEAIVQKRTQLVQTGIIIGCAFCEAVSIFGMLLALLFNFQYFFLWFALGILGMLSHIPRRKDLYAAAG